MAVDRIWRDGGSVCLDASMVVALRPEVAFDYVADLTRHPEWSAHRMRVTPLASGTPGVGSKYRAVARQLGRDWASEVTLTSYERPRCLEFAAVGGITRDPPDDPFRHRFTFTEVPGGTRLELRSRSREGSRAMQPLVALVARFPRPLLKRTPMAKAVHNLKQRLELMAASEEAK